jgi:hypothetical protein
MRERLEELNWRTTPNSRGEVGNVFDSKSGEVISTPISLKAQQKKKIA